MTFSVTILGALAAMPDASSITSAQVLTIRDQLYLIDCAEGCQMKLQKYGIRRNKIRTIFISHLHGDHLFGLPGLLTSFSHFQRTTPLTLVGPAGLQSFVNTCLSVSQAFIGYDIHIKELESEQDVPVYEDTHVRVYAFPLTHRIPTYGYRMEEKLPVVNMRADVIRQYKLDVSQIRDIKKGLDLVLADGSILKNSDVVYQKHVPRTYAYCSDTIYDERIAAYVKGVDLLYHEATYLNDLEHKASERMHATAAQAALIARKGGVSGLILGHFSARYGDRDDFLQEAAAVFEATRLAGEGITFEIPSKISNILVKKDM
jgi:ribonuclease Z